MKAIRDVMFCFQRFTKLENIRRLHFSYIFFCMLVTIHPAEMKFSVFSVKSTKVEKVKLHFFYFG